MENYTVEQFLEDVKAEATKLRDLATEEEKDRLNAGDLVPRIYSHCIYGQMTGDCFSPRASYLISACCRSFFTSQIGLDEYEPSAEAALSAHASTQYMEDVSEGSFEHQRADGKFYSSIEAYIMIPEAKNAELIAYLKGETDILAL